MRHTLVAGTALLALVLAAPARAHDAEEHAHKAPHGGIVRTAGKYHVELLKSGTGFDVYLLDEKEATMPIQGVTGKATCLTHAKEKLDLQLKPENDHFVAATDAKALEGSTIIIALRKGDEPISAKFSLHEHEEGHR